MASCPPSRNALTLRLSTPVGDGTDDDDLQRLFLSGIVNNDSSGRRVVQQTSDSAIEIPGGRVLAAHSSQAPRRVKAASSELDGDVGVMKITFALAPEESDGSFDSPVKAAMKSAT